jgi:hypothetical protein
VADFFAEEKGGELLGVGLCGELFLVDFGDDTRLVAPCVKHGVSGADERHDVLENGGWEINHDACCCLLLLVAGYQYAFSENQLQFFLCSLLVSEYQYSF